MLNNVRIVLLALTIIISVISPVDGRPRIELKLLENCNSHTDYSAKFNVTLKTIGDQQYYDGTIILKEDIDNTIRSNISIDTLIGNKYVYIFSINERKTCDALHKFLGEYIYDFERSAQILPKMCPILRGTYHLHNAPLDIEKVPTLKSFPLGTLRFNATMYNRKNQLYTCLVWVVHSRMV